MSEVETSIEPPEVDEGGGDGVVLIRVSVSEKDDTDLAAQVISQDDSDHEVAKALLLCLRGLASMRGVGF